MLSNHGFLVNHVDGQLNKARQGIDGADGGGIHCRPGGEIAEPGQIHAELGEKIVGSAVLSNEHPLVIIPAPQNLEILIFNLHRRGGAEKFWQNHVQVSPADIGKAIALAAKQLPGNVVIEGLPAGQRRQNGIGAPHVFHFHLPLNLLEHCGHPADAHRFEQVVVHTGLNSALGVVKFPIAADNHNVNVRLHLPRHTRQLNAVHAMHTDVGQQQVDGILLQKFQRQLPAGGGSGHMEAIGKLLNNRADEAKRRHLVIDN